MDQASSLNLGRDDKLQAHSLSRASGDSETFSLRDEDPLSEPSEGLLQHSKPTRHSHTIALLKTSAVNLVWILTWYMFATFLSVYNKWIFSIDHYNFQYPLFVTSIHMIVQFAFAGISITLVPQLRPTKRPTAREYLYKVFPCALATSLDIGLSNLSLKTITLTFYTMCKSSTLAFVLLFAFLFRLEKPSFKLVGIICIIIVGVVLMVSDETEFEFFGFVAVMSAAAFGGLRWALTEVLLRKESLGLTNPIASIFFLAPAQAVILIVLAAIVEGYPTIFGSEFFASFPTGMHTMFIVLAGGVLAFCMIMAEFFLIKRTSVVTLSVCGIFKEVATIFVSTIIFGDKLTVINTVGLCITLFGIGLYNWLKMRAAALKARKQVKDQELAAAQDTDFALDNVQRGGPQHMYSMVAESTPILLADGGMTEYRDSEDDDDDDYCHQREGDKRQRSSEQYELN